MYDSGTNLWRRESGLRIPRQGLVFYAPLWHPEFNGATFKAWDLVTPGTHTGTVTGATWGITGRTFGNDLNDNINCGDGTSLDITVALTLIAWLKIGKVDAFQQIVGRDDGTNRNYRFSLGSDNKLKFTIYISDTVKEISTTAVVVLNQVICLAGVHTGTQIEIYTDGASAGTPVAASGAIDNDNVSFVIGLRPATDYDYQGLVGEVLAYNRALPVAEIQHIYQATKWRYS